MESSDKLKNIFRTALDKLEPSLLVDRWLSRSGLQFEHDLWISAVGKASVKMISPFTESSEYRLQSGLVITPDDDSISAKPGFEILKSSHPIPGLHSFQAGKKLVDFAKKIPTDGMLINLISGGASSLAVYPPKGISIDDLACLYDLLIDSGADIYEINTVRKHLSRIKGGQLLKYLNPDLILIDLMISDVPENDPEVIGSGLTIPDSTTYQDAYHILLEYGIWDKAPVSVCDHIEKGIDGIVPETVKPGKDPITDHRSFIIGSARKLAEKIEVLLKKEGYRTAIAEQAYREKTKEVASKIAKRAKSVLKGNDPHISIPAALIFYGESTVKITGSGKGGRNQELALHAALEIDGLKNITWLSAGTDGIDGPTDAAGAIVDYNTIKNAEKKGIKVEEYLNKNDSYHFHKKTGTLLKTGPTGNNLMDIQIVIIE